MLAWHEPHWQLLSQRKKAARLPHALLLTGMPGVGKRLFAILFARALLCKAMQPTGLPCTPEKTCHACRLIAGKVHPNLLVIEPDQQVIKVEQIRAAIEFVNQTALQGGYQLMIIHEAHRLNKYAANALLKTLEEPSANSLMILISEHSNRLPATIVSRCQRLVFMPPMKQQGREWLATQLPENKNSALLLKLAHGAPLAALQLADKSLFTQRQEWLQAVCAVKLKKADPLQVAEAFKEVATVTLIDMMMSLLLDLLWLALTNDERVTVNEDIKTTLLNLMPHTSFQANNDYLIFLQQLRKQLIQGFNLNKQLILETMLIKWIN